MVLTTLGSTKSKLAAFLALAALASATVGCSYASPYMREVGALRVAATPSEGVVAFVRGASAFENGEMYSIFDETGRWLGDSMPNSVFAAAVSAGRHRFYAFTRTEVVSSSPPRFWTVGAVEASVGAGRAYPILVNAYVSWTPGGRPASRSAGRAFELVDMLPIRADGENLPDYERALSKATRFERKNDAGGRVANELVYSPEQIAGFGNWAFAHASEANRDRRTIRAEDGARPQAWASFP